MSVTILVQARPGKSRYLQFTVSSLVVFVSSCEFLLGLPFYEAFAWADFTVTFLTLPWSHSGFG